MTTGIPSTAAVSSIAVDKLQIVVDTIERRHEDMQHAAARLDAHRRPHHLAGSSPTGCCQAFLGSGPNGSCDEPLPSP